MRPTSIPSTCTAASPSAMTKQSMPLISPWVMSSVPAFTRRSWKSLASCLSWRWLSPLNSGTRLRSSETAMAATLSALGVRVQAADDLGRVARVVREVEDLVEVQPEIGAFQQRAQGRALVPAALRVLLRDPVGLVALHTVGDEREQHAL